MSDRIVTRKKIIYYGPISNVHLTKWANSVIEYHDVTILHDKMDKVQMQKIDSRISIVSVPEIVGMKYEGNRLIKIIYLLRLRKYIKSINYDLLHLHFMENKMIFFTNLESSILSIWGMDLVYDGSNNESIISKLLKKYMMESAKKLIVSSDFMYEYSKKYTKKVHDKMNVIKLGVDTDFFKPDRQINQNGKINILFAKHFYPKYGPKILLEAFKKLNDCGIDCKLVMLGEGPLYYDLKKQYQDYIKADLLEMPGKVEHNIVKHYLDISDIFIMPSIYDSETLGVAAIEALAMEKIVIATNVGGVPEVVIDGFTGYLVEKESADSIVSAVKEISQNFEYAREISKQGRNYVLENFDWNNCVGKILEIYQEV